MKTAEWEQGLPLGRFPLTFVQVMTGALLTGFFRSLLIFSGTKMYSSHINFENYNPSIRNDEIFMYFCKPTPQKHFKEKRAVFRLASSGC